MKIDLKSSAFLASLFFATSLSAAEARVVAKIKSDIPVVTAIKDRKTIENFLIENSANLNEDTVDSIVSLISKDKSEKQSMLKSLGEITGDIRFMSGMPQCSDTHVSDIDSSL